MAIKFIKRQLANHSSLSSPSRKIILNKETIAQTIKCTKLNNNRAVEATWLFIMISCLALSLIPYPTSAVNPNTTNDNDHIQVYATNDSQLDHLGKAEFQEDSKTKAESDPKHHYQGSVIYNLSELDKYSIRRKLEEIPVSDKIKKLIEDRAKICKKLTGCITRAIWIIPEYSKRESDAEKEKRSFYSPRFNTETEDNGYSLFLKIYPKGDGIGKADQSKNGSSYMSLFLAIGSTGHDEDLNWPFDQRITFNLIDQSGNNKHHGDSFYPDLNSSSYAKPERNVNIGAGCPLFKENEDIKSPYLIDDTLLIELTTSTPKMTSQHRISSSTSHPNTKNIKSTVTVKEKLVTCCFLPIFSFKTKTSCNSPP